MCGGLEEEEEERRSLPLPRYPSVQGKILTAQSEGRPATAENNNNLIPEEGKGGRLRPLGLLSPRLSDGSKHFAGTNWWAGERSKKKRERASERRDGEGEGGTLGIKRSSSSKQSRAVM